MTTRLCISTRARLRRIATIIERVDARCMEVDGPVTDTRAEITADEMREIYEQAVGYRVGRRRLTLHPGSANRHGLTR